MKVSPKADYPVRVLPESDEREESEAALFEGVYRVVLNHTVDVAFVPDVAAFAPPWDGRRLSGGIDDVAHARLLTALFTPYVVTPNDPLAGREERFDPPIDDAEPGAHPGVVFYVTAEEFTRYSTDLAELSEIVFSRWSDERVSDLRRFAVIGFLERRVVDSGWLRPGHAAVLGRGAAVADNG